MKVCYIIDGLKTGGKEKQLFWLIKSIIKNKKIKPQDILLITLTFESQLDNDFKKLGINFKYLIRRYKKDIFLTFKLNKILKEFKPNVIHSWSVMTSFYVSLIKQIGTLNFSFIEGSIRNVIPKKDLSLKNRTLNKINNHFADIIIANSNAGLIAYKAPKKKSIVIHNGFDQERLKNLENKESIKTKFNITTPNVVGMVARFCNEKQYPFFIKTAQEIIKKRKDITFLAIGDGPTLDKTKQ